ncbi:MAG: proline dehydrogenase family protein [Nitrososphaerota archaeon]|nr:proline dehydrogenase family protein [Nitrososphaerota archaeon]
MSVEQPVLDLSSFDYANPAVTLDAIREVNPQRFEFEMLRGIRDDLKLKLAEGGHRVVDYMPYGEEWYPYSVRRIKEHPSNILLLLRSL